jgi:hypothetical protein
MSVRRAPVGEITRSQRLREAKNSPLCLSRRDFDSRQTRNIGFDRFDSCAQHHATTAPRRHPTQHPTTRHLSNPGPGRGRLSKCGWARFTHTF